MNKFLWSIMVVGVSFTGRGQELDRSVRPHPGPAPVVNAGVTDTFSLPNGLRVFVVENHKLPVVECSIELDIRPALEGDMAGYKDMMNELLLCGTTTRPREKLNEEIDETGMTLETSDMGINASGLKRYEKKMFELTADIMMNAVFRQADLDRVKEKTLSELATIEDDPDAMVANVSGVVNFGSKHPYGEVPTPATVGKVTLDRCGQYYHTYFRPNVAYMAVVGDITSDEARKLVEKYFGKWQASDVPRAKYEAAGLTGERATHVDFVQREGAVQSVVDITYPLDIKPGDPDALVAQVTAAVLGGGAQGKLFQDLRENHGWTYGAYASATPDELGGTFSASVKCRNNVTDSAIEVILDDMRNMLGYRVPDSVVRTAIGYISGNFAISLENPRIVAQYAINVVRYHLPADYYKNYLKTLQAVNAGDVIEYAHQMLFPDNANIVVAGSRDDVAYKLARFSADGKVSYYDYTGRSLGGQEVEPAPPGITAEQVVANYIKAIGGAAAINSIKDIKIVGKSEARGATFTIEEEKKAPDMWMKQVIADNNGMKINLQKMAFDGNHGFQEVGRTHVAMTAEDMQEITEQSDMYAILHPEKYGIKRDLYGIETLDSGKVYAIIVTNSRGGRSQEFYDVNSGLLVKRILGKVGRAQISLYSDYRETPGGNGYKIPYRVTEKSGTETMIETVQTVEVNKDISDGDFE